MNSIQDTHKPVAISILSFGLLFALIDYLTKYYVVNVSSLPYYMNSGVAFSISIPSWMQIPLGVLLLFGILLFAEKIIKNIPKQHKKQREFMKFALAMVFGGGVGNFIDRLLYGSVVDFIDLKVWPIFNTADIFISLGVFIIVVIMYRK